MLKQGDIRADGYVFKSMIKDKKGNLKEHWLSPDAWKKWKEKRNFCNRENYYKNIETKKQRAQEYRKYNRAKCNARWAKYKSSKLQRTPSWLTEAQFKEIESFYEMAKQLEKVFPWKQEVDHIQPLQGKDVSGLHVPWNLQILPMFMNRSKGNESGI